MSSSPSKPAFLALSIVMMAAVGCDGRLDIEVKGEYDTANQDSGVGPGDTDSDPPGPNDTGDTNDTAGGSTSPNVNRSIGFEEESWRDVMWRTRKGRNLVR